MNDQTIDFANVCAYNYIQYTTAQNTDFITSQQVLSILRKIILTLFSRRGITIYLAKHFDYIIKKLLIKNLKYLKLSRHQMSALDKDSRKQVKISA